MCGDVVWILEFMEIKKLEEVKIYNLQIII